MEIFAGSDRDEQPIWSDGGYFGGRSSPSAKGVAKNGFYVLTGALCIWVFLYISALFPYLGYAERGERLGPGFSVNSGVGEYGVSRMLLFEGQTAFIDYDVQSDSGGRVYLDIKPVTTFGFSDHMQYAEANTTGRYEYVIPATGVYEFDHDFSLNGIRGSTQYTASWGAE